MVARLSTNLLLSTVLASAGDARKFLRARNSIGVVDTTTGSNGRILNEDINMDDYAQLELINKSFMVPVAPLASEETGEQAISIDWTEVIVPISSYPTGSPTLTLATSQATSLKPSTQLTSLTQSPTGNASFSTVTDAPTFIPTSSSTSTAPTGSPNVQLQQNTYQSKNKGKNKGRKPTPAPDQVIITYTPSPYSYDGNPFSNEDVARIDLPPISMSLTLLEDNVGEMVTSELSSLFSDYLMEYLHMELPARYVLRDISLDANYFAGYGTDHEFFVTGQLDLDNHDIDFTSFDQVLSLALLALFTEHDFVEVLRTADDEILQSTTEVKLALLKGIEKQSSISAAVKQDESDSTNNDNMYFLIACGGFGVAILFLGFSVYYSSKRKRARRSRSRKRGDYRARRNYSPDSGRSPNSYGPYDKCGIPVMDFVVEACSSFLTNDSGDRSGQMSVRTRDVEHNNCSFGSFWEPDKPKSRTRSSSMPPQRRPYPYPATPQPNGRGHVRRSSQPSDMSLAMKSQNMSAAASVREEWTCVDGVVTKKVRRGR